MTEKSTVYGKSKVLYVRVAPAVYNAIADLAKTEGVTKRIVCEALLRRELGFDDFFSSIKITERRELTRAGRG